MCSSSSSGSRRSTEISAARCTASLAVTSMWWVHEAAGTSFVRSHAENYCQQTHNQPMMLGATTFQGGQTHLTLSRANPLPSPSVASLFTRTWLRYIRVFAIAIPSVVCRLSVCRLSSVTLVHPTQVVEPFGKISSPLCTLAILWPPCKILRRQS